WKPQDRESPPDVEELVTLILVENHHLRPEGSQPCSKPYTIRRIMNEARLSYLSFYKRISGIQ
ncbi:hypothetical protein ATANTOWER_016286, partial [Ataeniobius toweri]|nr:hypothetical protein [Ataeniobius toweri]